MIVYLPSRRWLWGAAALALVAPLLATAGLARAPAIAVWLGADLVWVLALLADALLLYDGPGVPPARLDVRREAPPAFSVGRMLPVWYHWTAQTRRRLRLQVREELPAPLGGPQGAVREVEIHPDLPTRERREMRPVHRGVGQASRITVRVQGPLGLVWRQVVLERPWQVTVFPNLTAAALRSLPSQQTRRREAGLRAIRRPGEGRMFEGLREWVPGDDTRIIDWKATARRGKPIARQYEDERRQQVLLVIDAGRMLTAEVEGTPRLESVIDAALRLAHAAVEHDDNIGIMVFDEVVRRFVPPARGRRALRLVLETLAAVEGRLVEPDYPAAFHYLALRNRKRALTVLFTDVVDRTASEALVAQTATLRPRHLPLAVTVRDSGLERLATTRPATIQAAYERAAAEELLAAREGALAEMRERGIIVLDVPPASAAEAVVQYYHQLKRRGTL